MAEPRFFEYVCTSGRHTYVRSPRELAACPGCEPSGAACKHALKRIGEGSRKANAAAAA